jgi:hypothetical protein
MQTFPSLQSASALQSSPAKETCGNRETDRTIIVESKSLLNIFGPYLLLMIRIPMGFFAHANDALRVTNCQYMKKRKYL